MMDKVLTDPRKLLAIDLKIKALILMKYAYLTEYTFWLMIYLIIWLALIVESIGFQLEECYGC